MDRASLGSPNPASPPSYGERRRGVRQKLHTPVYVSFNGPETGLIVDLSELLDLNEHGFAVQTATQGNERLDIDRVVSLCLDLPETKSYVHGSGHVVWTDETGRAGVRFSFLPDSAKQVLREWLFTNLLIASANHASRSAQRENWTNEPLLEAPRDHALPNPEIHFSGGNGRSPLDNADPRLGPDQFLPSAASGTATVDRASRLSALDDLRRQIRKLEGNTDVILQIITEAARDFTGAGGAALAFITDGVMICRARAGAPSPPIGATVDTKSGLSGECVRTGRAVLCLDSETDPRVDAALCRALGLRSILAIPVFADFRVAGLLEAFSLEPNAFGQDHEIILERLVEMISQQDETRFQSSNAPAVESQDVAHPLVARKTVDSAPPVGVGTDKHEFALSSGVVEEKTTVQTAMSDRPPLAPAPPQPPEERNFTARNLRDAIRQQPPKSSEKTQSAPRVDPAPVQAAPRRVHAPDAPPPMRKVEAATTGILSSARRPKSKARKGQVALLISSIAVVAVVLGYVVAPVIEKRWTNVVIPSPTSAQAAVQAPAVAPASLQSANRLASDLSLDDLRKLAGQGSPEAQWRLGILYHNGEGVPQSDARAVEWFQRSASQGYVPALSALGSHYWSGRGVQQDYGQAYFWFELALAEGDERSKPLLEGLATQMSAAQVATARQQAEAWLQAHNQPTKPTPN